MSLRGGSAIVRVGTQLPRLDAKSLTRSSEATKKRRVVGRSMSSLMLNTLRWRGILLLAMLCLPGWLRQGTFSHCATKPCGSPIRRALRRPSERVF
jgi:hypothetical protein